MLLLFHYDPHFNCIFMQLFWEEASSGRDITPILETQISSGKEQEGKAFEVLSIKSMSLPANQAVQN